MRHTGDRRTGQSPVHVPDEWPRQLAERDGSSGCGVLRDAVMMREARVSVAPDIVRANNPTP